jgi:hypothetical protein
MRYKIIAAIGTLITITSLDFASASLTNIVYAQSAPSNSETGELTLSGESLRKVENLSIKDDYQNFFPRSGKQNNTLSVFDNLNYSLDENYGVWQTGDGIDVLVNRSFSPSIFPFPSPSRQNRSFLIDNLNRIELQFNLAE